MDLGGRSEARTDANPARQQGGWERSDQSAIKSTNTDSRIEG